MIANFIADTSADGKPTISSFILTTTTSPSARSYSARSAYIPVPTVSTFHLPFVPMKFTPFGRAGGGDTCVNSSAKICMSFSVAIGDILLYYLDIGNLPIFLEKRNVMTLQPTNKESQCWQDLDIALKSGIDRVLLYGQPGTGKTFYALNNHLDYRGRDRKAYRVLCSPDMTTADVDGLWKPSKEDWKFVTGSALKAWQGGDRLILDELDQASGDVLTALLLICDSNGSAVREHPETGETIKPEKGFEIIATTNAERLSDLPSNLIDRFPVRINISEVNPVALAVLPAYLQPIARTYANRTQNRYSLRSFFAYDHLSKSVELETAVRLVFGDESPAIIEAMKIAKAVNNERHIESMNVANVDITESIGVLS